ncbi:Methyltransferase domain-containing protein [Halomicrobium zhouii]|uniref:Arsenite methyltransferase n=1 Tax=Halomicrobium zhouii TaxID=767519 RepID=A0A1I6KIL0_9EURY|nr:arsenite methyltransferase [Halomicrobium zhouii]SFR90888.1 Methyltransferase domain-containing protein [Halomicrobium zhouii]
MSDVPQDSSLDRDADEQRRIVRERYADIATGDGGNSCCDDGTGDGESRREDGTGGGEGCCDDGTGTDSERLGYSQDDIEAVASGADLGLGCGNPKAMADLDRGETVLDLGSGAGFDCFLAANEVGDRGQVIGVDMTPEMVEKARENVAANDARNVEFRLGEIEHLPVADARIDVVISNCVVNLSPAKDRVFAEAFRVLVPGGRLAVSDVVLTASLPDSLEADPDSVAACVAGASPVPEIERLLADAGFVDVRVEPKDDSSEFISEWDDRLDPSEYVVAATIEARKPAAERD